MCICQLLFLHLSILVFVFITLCIFTEISHVGICTRINRWLLASIVCWARALSFFQPSLFLANFSELLQVFSNSLFLANFSEKLPIIIISGQFFRFITDKSCPQLPIYRQRFVPLSQNMKYWRKTFINIFPRHQFYKQPQKCKGHICSLWFPNLFCWLIFH